MTLAFKRLKIDSCAQEIYRPGTDIYHALNLCTAVGGDQNKEFGGNAFLREKGHIDQKAKNHKYSL